MTEQEAFQWWKTEQDEAGYKQSDIAALAWAAACKWEREACAKACEDVPIKTARQDIRTACATAIRMLSNVELTGGASAPSSDRMERG